jgi:hypothetical protein
MNGGVCAADWQSGLWIAATRAHAAHVLWRRNMADATAGLRRFHVWNPAMASSF